MPEPMPKLHIRLRIAGLITATGTACGVALVLAAALSNSTPLKMEDASIPVTAFVGALVGGLVTASLFGQPGRRGAALAVSGAFLSTIIGASIAGTLMFPGEGTFLAPVFLFVFMVFFFPIAILWIGLMYLVHRYGLFLRGHRETVLFQKQTLLPR